jgi:hypothetical protein
MTTLLHPISACFGYFSTLGSRREETLVVHQSFDIGHRLVRLAISQVTHVVRTTLRSVHPSGPLCAFYCSMRRPSCDRSMWRRVIEMGAYLGCTSSKDCCSTVCGSRPTQKRTHIFVFRERSFNIDPAVRFFDTRH